MLASWVRVDQPPASGLPALRFWFRSGDAGANSAWIERLRAFLSGSVEGFDEVRSSKAAIVRRAEVDGTAYFFKRFLLRGFGDRIKHAVRPSRAARAVTGGEIVSQHGFRVPHVVVLVEMRRLGVVVGSAFVSEAIEDAPDLKQWFGGNPELGLTEDWKEKRRLVRALAREVGNWHGAGLYHGDMRFGNILCRREEGSDGEYVFYWLDNERNRKFESLPLEVRVQNLDQLNIRRIGVALTDRLRFWSIYCEHAGVDRRADAHVRRVVQERTKSRWAKWGWLDGTGVED